MKPRKNNVLLKGTTKKTTDSGLYLPNKAENIERKNLVKEIEVLAVGEDVKGLKPGDKVVLYSDTLMKLAYNVMYFMFETEAKRKEEAESGNFYILVPDDEVKAIL